MQTSKGFLFSIIPPPSPTFTINQPGCQLFDQEEEIMCTYAVEPVYNGHLEDRRKWPLIYIPYPRVNCLKTIPFTAANTHIAHIWQYLPRDCIPLHSEMLARLVLKYFLHLGLIVLILFDLRDSYSPTVHDHKLSQMWKNTF